MSVCEVLMPTLACPYKKELKPERQQGKQEEALGCSEGHLTKRLKDEMHGWISWSLGNLTNAL